MQLHDLMNQHFRLDTRICTWIDDVSPETPESSKAKQVNKRKHCGDHDHFTSPSKLQSSPRSSRRALTAISGNTTPPNDDSPAKEKGTPSASRRSQRIQNSPTRSAAATAQNLTPQRGVNKGTQMFDDADDGTPRASSNPSLGKIPILAPRPIPMGYLPPVFHGPPSVQGGGFQTLGRNPSLAHSSSRSSGNEDNRVGSVSDDVREGSASGQSGDGNSSVRSTSPVKKRADWDMAEKPIKYLDLSGRVAREGNGILEKYEDLRALSYGKGTIPKSLKNLVEQYLDELDHPPAWIYSTAFESEYDRTIGNAVLQIHRNAQRCDKESSNEPQWNSDVHAKLLELVVKNPIHKNSVEYHNITTARIYPKSLSKLHVSGALMKDKMVDFAIVMVPDEALEDKIRMSLKNLPKESQSVNQTNHTPIRMTPIILNFETKPPWTGGETADVQLGTWGDAGFTKLGQMLEANNCSKEPIPTIPMVSFYGHEARLSAFQHGDRKNFLLGKMDLGSFQTIEGIFQILKALNFLVDWGNTVYRDWYFQHAIKA